MSMGDDDDYYTGAPAVKNIRKTMITTKKMTTKKKTTQKNFRRWMIAEDKPNGAYSPNPKKFYSSEAAAKRDAEALARDESRPFVLLKVIAVVEPATAPIVWTEDA